MGEFTRARKELQKAQDENSSTLSGLNTRVKGIDGRIGHLKEDFGRLNEDVGRMRKSQQELGDQMGTVHGEIASLVHAVEDEKKRSAARYRRLSNSVAKNRMNMTIA